MMPGTCLSAERRQRPLIRRFVVPNHVRVPIVRQYAKEAVSEAVPLVLNGVDKKNGVAERELDRSFVGLVAGITFHLDFHDFTHSKDA